MNVKNVTQYLQMHPILQNTSKSFTAKLLNNHECEKCYIVFANQSYLPTHIKLIHTRKILKHHECQKCYIVFIQKMQQGQDWIFPNQMYLLQERFHVKICILQSLQQESHQKFGNERKEITNVIFVGKVLRENRHSIITTVGNNLGNPSKVV